MRHLPLLFIESGQCRHGDKIQIIEDLFEYVALLSFLRHVGTK